jgi:O-antigen/teichoic acid export membrane protein
MTQTGQPVSKLIRGSALLFGGQLLSIGVKFLGQVLIVRYLTKEEYGALAYALAMVEIGVILALVALDNATKRYVPLYHEQKDYPSLFGLLVLSFAIVSGIGLCLVIGVYVFQNALLGSLVTDRISLSLLLILVVLAPLQAFDQWFQSIFASFSSVRAIFFRRFVLLPGLQLVVILLVIAAHLDVYWLAAGYLLTGALGTILYARMLYQLFRRRDLTRHFSWRNLKLKPRETIGYSLPLFFTGLVFIGRTQLITFLLEFFHGAVAVADFRAVQPAVRLNGIVYSSFEFMFLPLLARLLARNDGKGINEAYWRTTAWISVATFPIFLVTFSLAQPITILLFGERYASSGPIMAILSLGAYVNAVMGFNKDTLRVYHRLRYLLLVDLATMLVTLISCVIFIPRLGALGGAGVSAFALILTNILFHIGLSRLTPIRLFEPAYLRIYAMIVLGAGGLALFQALWSPPLYVSLPIAALISFIVLRANAPMLEVGRTFPELLRLPVLGRVLQ